MIKKSDFIKKVSENLRKKSSFRFVKKACFLGLFFDVFMKNSDFLLFFTVFISFKKTLIFRQGPDHACVQNEEI